jgi:peptide chain release factor 1
MGAYEMIEPQDLRITSYLPQSGHGSGGMTVGLNPSGIIAHHIPSGVGVSCDSERSQHANKEKAVLLLELLMEML